MQTKDKEEHDFDKFKLFYFVDYYFKLQTNMFTKRFCRSVIDRSVHNIYTSLNAFSTGSIYAFFLVQLGGFSAEVYALLILLQI